MGYKRLTNEQELSLIEEYRKGNSVKSLMEKYGFATKKSVTDKIKKHFPDTYKSIIEEAKNNRKDYNYRIEKISNDFDAYFIGLMLTDGYISEDRKVGIDLADEDCIAFLSNSIGKSYKSYEPSSGNLDINGKKMRHRLILSDIDLVEDLKKYSVTPNKSKTLKGVKLLPEEEKYLPYIIRGIIDGDGCISLTSYGSPQFYIVSASEDFIDWVKYVLENKLYMKDIHKKKDSRGLYKVETADKENLIKLKVLCYDKHFGMERKYNFLTETFRDYNSAPVI